MNVKMWLAASALLLAGPALAEEPLNKIGPEPATQAAPQASPGPAATEPHDRIGAQPGTDAMPAAPRHAATDAPADVVITELIAAKDGKKLVHPWGVPVDRVAEMDVYDANGKKIGQVDAVLEDKSGEVRGVAVGYGGFLGFGEKGAIVTLDRLKLKDGTVVTELSEDQLDQQPAWPKK